MNKIFSPFRISLFSGLNRYFSRINFGHVFFDALLVAGSLYASLFLRLGQTEFLSMVGILNKLVPLFIFLRISTFIVLRIYDIKWRFVSVSDASLIIKACFTSTLIIIAATYFVNIGYLPRSTFIIDFILITLLIGGTRVLRRMLYERRAQLKASDNKRLVLLYGAGECGRAIAHTIRIDSTLGLELLGFIDDDPRERGREIQGAKVLGTRNDLAEILVEYPVKEVIVSIQYPSRELLQNLISELKPYNLKPRMVANLGQSKFDMIGGRGAATMFRKIELSDLLGRPKKILENKSVAKLIKGKSVLITGAGGSIGSELARQTLSFDPARLILLDHSEQNLFEIDRELRLSDDAGGRVVPILGEAKNKQALQAVFAAYKPEIVIHAAAYKHVHLVELNPYSAILNNIGATNNLVELSEEYAVETFILISTDKAVRPGGVMGATKRVCELLVQAAGERSTKRYCSVRFGNVLGSSGSLIPLLQKQINENEPMTITHPEMTRYFMLIPEAVSLVLRAATMSSPGDIAILKMGDPIRITDIATSLRSLMGKTEAEVPIVFTGVRPGEKMSEELYINGDEVVTDDPDILLVPKCDGEMAYSAKAADFSLTIGQLIKAAEQEDEAAIKLLRILTDKESEFWIEQDHLKQKAAKLTVVAGR